MTWRASSNVTGAVDDESAAAEAGVEPTFIIPNKATTLTAIVAASAGFHCGYFQRTLSTCRTATPATIITSRSSQLKRCPYIPEK